MSMSRRDMAEAARQKARRALRTARLSLEDGDADAAVNRAYYAVFHLASAALELAGEHPKTHKGVHNRFWQCFVETNQFPIHLGGLLSRAHEQREKADYDAFTRFDTTAATDLISDVEAFTEEADSLLDQLETEDENSL